MGVAEDLKGLLGENFRDDLTERLSHSADMGFIPELVWSGIKINIVPDYVVYPRSVEDVINVVKIALKYKVPLTPYGRGTNRYGNAIPADGGILLDFSKMSNVSIDKANKVAIVEPGATWKLVDIYAQQEGLQLRTFPSSYDSSVGGGIASDSLGIGSYEYGFISDNVTFVDIVNPRGDIVRLEGKDLALACGAEGTTGIIVRAGIKLRNFSPTEAMVISFDSLDQMVKAVGEFYREVIPAWHVQVRGPYISTYMAEKYKAPLDPQKWNMVILYPSPRSPLVEPKVYKISQAYGGKVFEGEWTGWWSFNHGVVAALRTQGLLIHQHGLIHYTALTELLNNLSKTLGKIGELSPDGGYDVDIALERREVLLVNSFTQVSVNPVDKKILYDLAKNTLMMEEYIKVGGSLLSIGIFAHKYAKNRLNSMGKTFMDLGVDRYEAIKKYKEEADPEEIFNPGKLFDPKNRAKAVLEIPSRQQEALRFRFGIGIAKRLSPGGEVDGFKHVRRYLEDFADYALMCIDCAMCVTVCPQYRLIPQWPYAPKGMFDFVKGAIAYHELQGTIDIPDSAIAELSGCHKCGLCDGVCPAKIPISTLLLKLNSLVAKKMPEEPSVDLPLLSDEELSSIIDPNSQIILWIGKNMMNNPSVATTALKLIKKMGLKVKIIGTGSDSGFLDYISGNGNKFVEKMKQNLNVLSNSLEIVTITPEDYRTFSTAYKDYSKLLGTEAYFEVVPLELRLLKSIMVEGNNENVNLHIACFSSSYADEIVRRLSEKGFRVKKIEGCSGAVLEKSLGKRADLMAKAIGEKYGKIITLCPLAAAKFRSVGINAITLIEFLAEKLGIQSPEYQVITFKLSEKDKEYIKSLLLSSLLGSLNARADVIADTATFSTSGLDEYKKIIEPIVSESVDEIAKSISAKLYDTIKSLITEKSSSKPIIIAEYIRELSNVLSTIELDKAIQPFMTLLRSKIKEEYDEKVVSLALIQLLRENEERLKNILSTELNKM
ncbi:FAD-linked oxidase [Sulfolobus sp. A20]|uniref:FAD-binding and (Fe-S)-binding domain-containing protein n=1 Tax=Sulfolobaceae TaxID=118883 RepID=UPI000845C44D|nr:MULTISPECIES: FAD-binding and (Fe-S)-binding domain-containing protein [unclassified Sulfolobus]TRM77521.1 FAD-binding oxidoreductase [Sulfolobus sp. A20-N-F8]TRM79335.1 FAD-binding oxidoreductase [Sulfolobus sp. B5]TRM83003.1 FAD-binding oxidoreductase [Sulfolobus sp. A20-N-F6]TRM84390.1 FAD-binding oxidoreductase [Sulfolobus sp. F3]TRM89415.1 FAD-binding oxidoreductase [Sulfolobus sp. C3]TRM99815.1 FAD-binding oxidoreductase [Sulfolobus sp. E1]